MEMVLERVDLLFYASFMLVLVHPPCPLQKGDEDQDVYLSGFLPFNLSTFHLFVFQPFTFQPFRLSPFHLSPFNLSTFHLSAFYHLSITVFFQNSFCIRTLHITEKLFCRSTFFSMFQNDHALFNRLIIRRSNSFPV